MRTLIHLALIGSFFAFAPANASDYQIINTTTTSPATNLSRTVQEVQIGTDGNTKINITRVRRTFPSHYVGPVMLMAPLNFDVRFYEVESNVGDYKSSLIGRLAVAGFDVWVVDDRINRLPAGSCITPLNPGGTVDCSFMSTWTLSARVEDAEFARGLVAAVHGSEKPVIGGFSGGSIAALAVINAHPDHYSGILGWQGTIYSADPAVQAYNEPFCALAESFLAAGIYNDDSAALLKFLLANAQATPAAPVPQFLYDQLAALGVFPPANLNFHQFLVWFDSTHIVNPNFPTPNWIAAVGDYTDGPLGTHTYIDEAMYFQLLPQLNETAGVAQFRDISCGLAGETTFVGNLDAFEGKVLFLGTEFSFGPLMEDTADLMTGASSRIVDVRPGRGELDRYMTSPRLVTDLAIIGWLYSILL